MREREMRFREAVERRDGVAALIACPWGYTSRHVPEGFRFTFDSGPYKGRDGVGRTLEDAIVRAMAPATTTGEG